MQYLAGIQGTLYLLVFRRHYTFLHAGYEQPRFPRCPLSNLPVAAPGIHSLLADLARLRESSMHHQGIDVTMDGMLKCFRKPSNDREP